jgi:hypothetical protein
LAIDQGIVLVCFVKNIEVWTKGLVDILLEYCRYICEPKGNDQGSKEAIAGAYGCLPDIFISYRDKGIGIANVNFEDVFSFG